jgi:hypothetical protein
MEELTDDWAAMGIIALCIAPEFGTPFLDVDWGSLERDAYPPEVHEMVVLFDAMAISARFQRRTDGSSLPKAGSPPVA